MQSHQHNDYAVKLANAVVNQITKFHLEREQSVRPEVPPCNFLYHYTTAEGLKGIIENNELWAISAYFLNDSTEIVYGYALLTGCSMTGSRRIGALRSC